MQTDAVRIMPVGFDPVGSSIFWMGAIHLFSSDLKAALPRLETAVQPRSMSRGPGHAVLVAGATVIFVEECDGLGHFDPGAGFTDFAPASSSRLAGRTGLSGPQMLGLGGHATDGVPKLVLSTLR